MYTNIFRLTGLFSVVTCVFLSGCCTQGVTKHPDKAVSVSDVVSEVQDAIDDYYAPANGLPGIKSVKVSLQTVHDDKFSAEVDYLIVALKGYYDKATTQEIDLTLVPKSVENVRTVESDVTKTLKQLIAGARNEIKDSYTHNGHTLNTNEIDVRLDFTVSWDITAGVNKWVLTPVSVNASNDYSSKTVQSITVAFSKP